MQNAQKIHVSRNYFFNFWTQSKNLQAPHYSSPCISRPCCTYKILAVPARPVPWQDFYLVPLSLCPGTMMEPSVPLSRKVALSRPVGNTNIYADLCHYDSLNFV